MLNVGTVNKGNFSNRNYFKIVPMIQTNNPQKAIGKKAVEKPTQNQIRDMIHFPFMFSSFNMRK